jgi:hypothetical protein
MYVLDLNLNFRVGNIKIIIIIIMTSVIVIVALFRLSWYRSIKFYYYYVVRFIKFYFYLFFLESSISSIFYIIGKWISTSSEDLCWDSLLFHYYLVPIVLFSRFYVRGRQLEMLSIYANEHKYSSRHNYIYFPFLYIYGFVIFNVLGKIYILRRQIVEPL